MQKNPKVSIIMPIFNVEKYLSRALSSAVNQTLKDIEIVCVNDGTKDQSADIVKEYGKRDNRILFIDKENGGVASARNAGIKAATGDILLFLDPDDYLERTACERVYEEYISHFADIIVFGSTPFPEIPEPDEWVVWKLNCYDKLYEEFEAEALFQEACATPFVWNHAFVRKFLNDHELLFEENIHFGEDIIFLFMTMPKAKKIQFIGDKLHYYQCYRSGSLMDKYGADKERKMLRHVKNVALVTEYWEKNGFLSKWGSDYFEWAIKFIVPDLISYDPENKKELAEMTVDFFEKNNLIQYKKKTRLEARECYRRLVKMSRED